jgi:hypothetical protein
VVGFLNSFKNASDLCRLDFFGHMMDVTGANETYIADAWHWFHRGYKAGQINFEQEKTNE